MKHKLLIVAAVATALAFPAFAQTGKPAAGGNDGGAEAMFKALDKDKDGFISKGEAKGTPHDKDFTTLDKNRDGKLSRPEHADAPEHKGAATKGGGSAGGSGSKY